MNIVRETRSYTLGMPFDPDQWARQLIHSTLPALAATQPWHGWEEVRARRENLDDHLDALIAVMRLFLPPPDLPGGMETYLVVTGMAALRAFSNEMVTTHMDIGERYQAAANWICENFGELIFWNCH